MVGALDNRIDGLMRATFGLSTGLLLSGSLCALLVAFVIRFLAVAVGALDAGLARISPNLDAAARALGETPLSALRRIHLPLLTPAVASAGSRPAPQAPTEPLVSLVEARWQLSGRKVDPCVQTMTAQGYGPGDMTFAAKPSTSFRITVSRDGQPLSQEIRFSGADGKLDLHLAIDAREPVELRFECHE